MTTSPSNSPSRKRKRSNSSPLSEEAQKRSFLDAIFKPYRDQFNTDPPRSEEVRRELREALRNPKDPETAEVAKKIYDTLSEGLNYDPTSLRSQLIRAPKHWPHTLQELKDHPITDDSDSSYQYKSDSDDNPYSSGSESSSGTVSIPPSRPNHSLFGCCAVSRSPSPSSASIAQKIGITGLPRELKHQEVILQELETPDKPSKAQTPSEKTSSDSFSHASPSRATLPLTTSTKPDEVEESDSEEYPDPDLAGPISAKEQQLLDQQIWKETNATEEEGTLWI